MRFRELLARQTIYAISRASLICAFSVSFAAFGQSDIDVAETAIERITNNQFHHQDAELIDGSHWQLNARELERVEMLQEGFRQYVSDRQISPLEVLGIHARNESERNRYARHWAKLMIEDAERVLAFQRAYDEAIRDLLDDRPLVDLTRLPAREPLSPSLVPTDRLAVFVELDCSVCEDVLQRVLRFGRQTAGVDIYVMESDELDKSVLHAWANRQAIPPSAVQAKHITLNFDDGLLKRINPRAIEVPVVLRRRDNQFAPMDPWAMP